jgi:hypothetical protein
MNLSSLVHASKIRQKQSAAAEYFTMNELSPEKYQRQRHPADYYSQDQLLSEKRQMMAASLVSNPYTVQQMPYQYIQPPQAPPSPPVEEVPKCSLPSISSLLGGMPENGSPPQEQTQRENESSSF